MDITMRQIRYFVATAETGQVSRAAELCNITQSSVTLAIGSLETLLGQKLFLRQSRGMQLTAQGEGFLRHCKSILQSIDDALEARPDASSEVSGCIRLGVTGTISGYVFPPIWRQLKREYPEVELDVQESGYQAMETGLREGRLDMAMMLISNIKRSSDFYYEELVKSPRRLWVSNRNPLATKETVSLRDLDDVDYIVPTMDDHEYMIKKYWKKNGFKPKILFRSKTLEALRSMVANDLGVAILSDMVYRSLSLEGRRIIRRDLIETPPSSDVGIAWLKGKEFTPAENTLLTMLKSNS